MYIAKNVRVISFWLLFVVRIFVFFSHFNKEAVCILACVCEGECLNVRVCERHGAHHARTLSRACCHSSERESERAVALCIFLCVRVLMLAFSRCSWREVKRARKEFVFLFVLGFV